MEEVEERIGEGDEGLGGGGRHRGGGGGGGGGRGGGEERREQSGSFWPPPNLQEQAPGPQPWPPRAAVEAEAEEGRSWSHRPA